MTATRIIEGLERSPATGSAAQDVARLGFLEWAFTGDEAAQDALNAVAAQRVRSDAARAFVDLLHDACQPLCRAPGRRRRARAH
ncbi:hypothetical protein D6850_05485 [Roseovarius spongiae]|uniref:Uncharacterized protein n=1 Tax=Roseovarius spongiae TaxID=2320272 RepID=A0A3A8AZE8_9RHOB|nr:hypothetical protein [Roseovarius spongiae]RKF16979.1 hypothetical protein D6850_05485 [Roseovarius spongiae]